LGLEDGMMPPLDQAGAWLPSPVVAGCGAVTGKL
jgi:hypothetical protein